MGKCLDFFAGGNTPQGFFSYYDYIMPQEAARKIICIKGGPGTGKSTLMKKTAEKYRNYYEVELMHCSSDPDSLDGVVIPALGFAVIDGTAPHIVDPKNPGAVDCIFNAGDFWCDEAVTANHDDIIRWNGQISQGYCEAYYYLNLAGRAKEHQMLLRKRLTHETAVEQMLSKMTGFFRELREPILLQMVETRKLFLKAITPKGIVDYGAEFRQNAKKVHTINAYYSAAGSELLMRLDQMFRVRGYVTETFFSPFAPQNAIEGLYVPAMETFFALMDNETDAVGAEWNLDEFVTTDVWPQVENSLRADEKLIDDLLQKVIAQFAQNKKWHDALEMCYIPYIDFNKLTQAFMKLLP